MWIANDMGSSDAHKNQAEGKQKFEKEMWTLKTPELPRKMSLFPLVMSFPKKKIMCKYKNWFKHGVSVIAHWTRELGWWCDADLLIDAIQRGRKFIVCCRHVRAHLRRNRNQCGRIEDLHHGCILYGGQTRLGRRRWQLCDKIGHYLFHSGRWIVDDFIVFLHCRIDHFLIFFALLLPCVRRQWAVHRQTDIVQCESSWTFRDHRLPNIVNVCVQLLFGRWTLIFQIGTCIGQCVQIDDEITIILTEWTACDATSTRNRLVLKGQ